MIDIVLAEIKRVYGWNFAPALVSLMRVSRHNPFVYFGRFWSTNRYSGLSVEPLRGTDHRVARLAQMGSMLQLLAGAIVCVVAATGGRIDLLLFGFAIVVAYPLIWAHLLPLLYIVGLPRGIKSLGKAFICRRLERQVKRLRRKHEFALVAVAGSVGKTSTKLAIAQALGTNRRVRYQDGNYNDRLTVPLIFFGHTEPGLYNIFAWFRILLNNRRQLRREYPYDIVVVELGTDEPGQMAKFAYLQPDLVVLTSAAPEHMERFHTLDGVAEEELQVFAYGKRVLANIADIDAKYLEGREYVSYGTDTATYSLKSAKPAKKLSTQRVTYDLAGRKVSASIPLLGTQGAKIGLAAAATACELALSPDDVSKALENLQPFAGRMQPLKGIKNSTIIDDTYNASPSAVAAALDVLQSADAKQRIAILGSMNELGETSPDAHRDVGKLCNPKKLDLVVTIGKDARNYLAPAAAVAGCTVESFLSPYEAGEFVKGQLQSGAVVLAKGSQKGVFAEEAVKLLLKDSADTSRLVRQSDYWMRVKRSQFGA
jgi:UDP-N-acetylmuramoyl-tripeptide--D-alanyl-D-alanine ligase